jgi:hypothetical protein
MNLFKYIKKKLPKTIAIVTLTDTYETEKKAWLSKIPDCRNNQEFADLVSLKADIFYIITNEKLWEQERFKH